MSLSSGSLSAGTLGSGALTERQRQLLMLCVSHFIKTVEPVASRTLVKTYKLPVGAATIRNEMADLEEMGYLEQPHTSAGRIPTDKGYREYVDNIKDFHLSDADKSQLRELEEKYLTVKSEFQEVLNGAVRILSEITNMVGVAARPNIGESHIEKIQLLDVGHRRVLVVLVTCSGMVETHVVATDGDLGQERLEKVSRIFNENFSNASIKDFLGGYLEVLTDLQLEYRNAVKSLLDKFFETLGSAGTDEREAVIEGATAVIRQPEFANLERARELLTSFEGKDGIIQVVTQINRSDDTPEVRIGVETRHRVMRDLAMVVTSYTSGGLERGTIGIIGPRRMNYPRVIASVDYISKVLSRTLTKAGV